MLTEPETHRRASRPTARPWWNALLVGNPPKKIMTRYMPRFTRRQGEGRLLSALSHERRDRCDAQGVHDESADRNDEVLMRKVHWLELTTEEFAGPRSEKTIAVLPIAAIEQHGPHLAVSTDTDHRPGHGGRGDRKAAGGPRRAVPPRSVGRQVERAHPLARHDHLHGRDTQRRVWTEIGEERRARRRAQDGDRHLARRQRRHDADRGARTARRTARCFA